MNYKVFKLENIERRYKITAISTFVFGLFAHGYMFLNKFSFLDDVVSLTTVGATYSSGRWFLGILESIVRTFFYGTYSVPWFIGLVSLCIIAGIGILLVDIFDIKNDISCLIIGGLLITFPAMTGLYSFMFTSGYYTVSMLLSVLAVWLVIRTKYRIIGVMFAVLCIACSMGIYQSIVGFAILAFLFLYIVEVFEISGMKFKDYVLKAVLYVGTLVGGLASYLIINKVFLTVMSVELNSYRGISSMYSKEVVSLNFELLFGTFFNQYDSILYFKVFVEKTGLVYWVVLIISLLLIIYNGMRLAKEKKFVAILVMTLAALCIPVALNPFALVNTDMVTSLVQLPKVMILIFPVILMEHTEFRKEVIQKAVWCATSILLIYVNIYYAYYANRCYLAAEIHQAQTISWMTTLVTQIKNVEGFDENMEIAYIGEVEDKTFISDKSYFETLEERFYNVDVRKQYVWKSYMQRWCGFHMKEVDQNTYEKLENLSEVQNMKNYPNDGSIQIVDDIVVVKF